MNEKCYNVALLCVLKYSIFIFIAIICLLIWKKVKISLLFIFKLKIKMFLKRSLYYIYIIICFKVYEWTDKNIFFLWYFEIKFFQNLIWLYLVESEKCVKFTFYFIFRLQIKFLKWSYICGYIIICFKII